MNHAVRRWTRRIIVGTILTIVLIVAVGLTFFAVMDYRFAQFDRTYEHELATDPNNGVLVDAHALLARLQDENIRDGLRFAAMPSFGDRWFAVSLSEREGGAIGEVIVFNRADESVTTHKFGLTRGDARRMLDQWDEHSDGYPGDSRGWTDGTSIAFERLREGRVSSAVGNSPCHYDVLGNLAAIYIGPQVNEVLDLRAPHLAKMLESDVC